MGSRLGKVHGLIACAAFAGGSEPAPIHGGHAKASAAGVVQVSGSLDEIPSMSMCICGGGGEIEPVSPILAPDLVARIRDSIDRESQERRNGENR